MTISNAERKSGPHHGNGLTSSFPFYFRVFDKADVQVIFTSTANAESALVLDSHFQVLLNDDQTNYPGGSVIYPHPTAIIPLPPKLATGEKLTILSNVALSQLLDITNGGGFYPEIVETALDKATMQIQQLDEKVGRAVLAPVSSGVAPGNYFQQVVDYTAQAQAAAAAAAEALPIVPYLDEIGTLAPIAPQIVEVAAHSGNVDTVGSNIGYVQAIGGDLAGTGWSYDFGAITDPATNPATATSAIIQVANNITAVQNANANATAAAASAAAAATSASLATAKLQSFSGVYYGPLASNPTLDPNGAAVGTGDLYFNTTVPEMRVYNGTTWVAAYVTGTLGALAAKNTVSSSDFDPVIDMGVL